MTLSYRISVCQLLTDGPFEELLALLRRHRPAVDEISLFTGYWHHLFEDPQQFAALAETLARRVEQLHAEGIAGVGINMLCTLGHLDEAWDFLPPLPFDAMVGHDGSVSRSCACPTSGEFRRYITAKYRRIAEAGPDFIWVDDDIRMHHHGVAFGCFCERCIEAFSRRQGPGAPADRPSLVSRLNSPDAGPLRRAWVLHNADVLDELLADLAAAIHDVDGGIDVGLMTTGPSWTTYSGQALARWMATLGGRRVRPGGGFYDDGAPRAMIPKALDVARQCVAVPEAVTDVQYELENFPYQKLDKSVRIVLDECWLALAAGCNGVAFNCLKDLPGALEDYDDVLAAIEGERPVWEAWVEAAAGLELTGLWPATRDDWTARREVRDGQWFATGGGDYDVQRANVLAEIGLPLTARAGAACGTVLCGRLAEIFDDEDLRRMLSGGVLMDAAALEVLWDRGLGELAGVRPGRSYDNGVYERFTGHELNGPYTGDGRDVRLSFWAAPARRLVPLSEGVADLAHMIGYDGSDCGPCLTAFENDAGGRVATMGYAPWRRLGNSAKRSQVIALADWAARGRVPILIPRTVRVTPLIRMNADRTKMAAVLLNTAFDPTGELEILLRADVEHVDLLGPDGASSLPLRRRGNDRVVTLGSLGPWQTAALVGR